MYTSSNAAWVSCAIVDRDDEFKASTGMIYSLGTGTTYVMAQCLLPTNKGSLKLYIGKTRIVVTKADAAAYVDEVRPYATNSAGTTALAVADGTNQTTAGDLDYDFTDADASSYDTVWVQVKCTVDAANELGIGAVQVWAYYDS